MGDETSLSLSSPKSLPFPFPGVQDTGVLNNSNLCNNKSNPTSPSILAALPPTPEADPSGVGADLDFLHGLFLGRVESEGREEQIERGF